VVDDTSSDAVSAAAARVGELYVARAARGTDSLVDDAITAL
jgi:hypothetical protein